MRKIARIRVGCLLLTALLGGVAGAAPINVMVKGLKVGELDVTGYADTSMGGSASMTINADFTKAGQAPGGQALLDIVAPLGLTYMQTVTVRTDLQQKIFRDASGNNLLGTFSDPPYLGYTLPGGGRDFNDDTRPWYSNIQPSGVVGDIPPNSFGVHQFRDTPTVPFADFADVDHTSGLANLLNGKDGSLNFETALVGVCNQPDDNGKLDKTNPAFTGAYKVCVLEDFMWGLNFTYVGPKGGRDPGHYVAADYMTAAIALAFKNDVSAAFRGAFDKAGNNAGVEWYVSIIQADECPEPSTAFLLCGGIAVFVLRRSRIIRETRRPSCRG